MDTLPLDADSLLATVAGDDTPFTGLPPGTTIGHVHLQVASIPETLGFYRDLLGFEETVTLGGQATFLAAGGYHHHVGANTWNSLGAGSPPAGAAALVQATIVLPDAGERDRLLAVVADDGQEPQPLAGGAIVRDPAGNALLLSAAP